MAGSLVTEGVEFPGTPSGMYSNNNCSSLCTFATRARTLGESSVFSSRVLNGFQDVCNSCCGCWLRILEFDRLSSGEDEVGMAEMGAGGGAIR